MAFVFSKIAWMFIAPGNLLVLLLLLSAFLATAKRESWQNTGRRLSFDIALLLFFIAIFPVGEWMLQPLENRFETAGPDQVDGIVLIGGEENPMLTEIRGQPIVHGAAADYMMFASLAKKYPQAKLVYAGGSSLLNPGNLKFTDAQVAKDALASFGVPVDKMVFEDKSRNTRENAEFAATLVHPKSQEKWLLVTSAFHMPRSIGCFRKAGWHVFAAPTNYFTRDKFSSDLNFDFSAHLGAMTTAMHEYYGLVSYWLLGYIDSPWPKP